MVAIHQPASEIRWSRECIPKRFAMAREDRKSETELDAAVSARMEIGSWTLLVALCLFLGCTIVVSYLGWMLSDGTNMPASGYVAMTLGVFFSLGVGFGLMALIFYSSRKGYD
jgi:hypothetical protein